MKRLLIGIIILFAAFLRLFRIQDFYMFLADQGRDALIIKKIVLLQKFPAIGPPSSIGEIFLGPFFYYLVAPFLALSRLHPVGLAIGVAVLSVLGIGICFFYVSRTTNSKVGLLFLFISAFSYRLIESARFSWNPNLLAYFSFITLFFFAQAIREKKLNTKIIYTVAWGVFFSLSFQLHHLAAFLFLPVCIIYIALLFKRKVSTVLLTSFIGFVSFLISSLPLILFEIKNNFLNSHSLFTALTKQNVVSSGPFIKQWMETASSFFTHAFSTPFSPTGGMLFLFLFSLFTLSALKNRKNLYVLIHFIFIWMFLIAFTKISSQRFPHYFGSIYVSFFFVFSYLIETYLQLIKNKVVKTTILIALMVLFLFIQVKQYYFFTNQASRQDRMPTLIGAFIAKQSNKQPLNLATYPIEFTSEDCYQYFIELNGGRVADRKKQEVTNQMFVLCDKEPCNILTSRSWNIDMFGKAKIDTMWNIEGINIYKLSHIHK